MCPLSSDVPRDFPEPLVAVLGRLRGEYLSGGASEQAVTDSVRNAAHAVRFFGDDPAVEAPLVERMARNELDILVGRDSDRART